MTAGLVSTQFLLYGQIKHALGARPGLEVSDRRLIVKIMLIC